MMNKTLVRQSVSETEKEIDFIRLSIHEKHKHLSIKDRVELINKKGEEAIKKYDLKLGY